jgi:hypothetical protein
VRETALYKAVTFNHPNIGTTSPPPPHHNTSARPLCSCLQCVVGSSEATAGGGSRPQHRQRPGLHPAARSRSVRPHRGTYPNAMMMRTRRGEDGDGGGDGGWMTHNTGVAL